MSRVARPSMVLLAVALLAMCQSVGAQAARPNGVFLIAKPELLDPNFRRTVVLVTQTDDAQTIGVIINRPTQARLTELLPDEPAAANYQDAVYLGGPVMQRILIAVFRSEAPPPAAAFEARRGLYLSMHPENIKTLLGAHDAQYRLYTGFSGWSPHQLEAELARDSWYVLPADAEMVFRKSMEGVWEELLERAMARKTRTQNKKPRMGAGLGARDHRAIPPERHLHMQHDAALWIDATCRLLECGSLIRAHRTGRPESRVCTIRPHGSTRFGAVNSADRIS